MSVQSKPLPSGAKPVDVRDCFFKEVVRTKVVNGKNVKEPTGTWTCKLCEQHGEGKNNIVMYLLEVSCSNDFSYYSDTRPVKACSCT